MRRLIVIMMMFLILSASISAECFKRISSGRWTKEDGWKNYKVLKNTQTSIPYEDLKEAVRAISNNPEDYSWTFGKGTYLKVCDFLCGIEYRVTGEDFVRALKEDASLRKAWRTRIDKEEFLKLADTDEHYLLFCKIAEAAELP